MEGQVARSQKKFGVGDINFMAGRENVSNCRALHFFTARGMNKWFANNHGYLVVQAGSNFWGHNLIVGKVLSDEEYAEMMEIMELVNIERDKRAQARREQEDKRKEAEEAAKQEQLDLLELGKKCRENHAAIIEENRKMKEHRALRKVIDNG